MNSNPTQTKREKRYFSPEEKLRLYQEWKLSGINRNRFCKQHDIIASAFTKWCRKLSNENSMSTKNDWVPVVSKEQIITPKKEVMVLEIKILNATKICTFLIVVAFILLLNEFLHAIAVVR